MMCKGLDEATKVEELEMDEMDKMDVTGGDRRGDWTGAIDKVVRGRGLLGGSHKCCTAFYDRFE